MENVIAIPNSRVQSSKNSRFVMDTTFVLFFLAMDIGIGASVGGFDRWLSIATLVLFIAAPYVLPFDGEKPEFRNWCFGRIVIALTGILIGLALYVSLGNILPEWARFLPMTLLLVSGIFCVYTQIYGIIRVRLAR